MYNGVVSVQEQLFCWRTGDDVALVRYDCYYVSLFSCVVLLLLLLALHTQAAHSACDTVCNKHCCAESHCSYCTTALRNSNALQPLTSSSLSYVVLLYNVTIASLHITGLVMEECALT